MSEIGLTFFRSREDNKTDKKLSFNGWSSFSDFLEKLTDKPGKKPSRGEIITSEHAALISPALYDQGQNRRKDAVYTWAGWAALDVDDYTGALENFDPQGVQSLIYSTPSSREGNPKFRLVVSLSRWLKREEISDFWYALNMSYLGVGDPAAKDTSRMYYVPGDYPDAWKFFKRFDGDPIDPSKLMADYPLPKIKKYRAFDRIPAHLQAAIMKERHSNLIDRGINLNWAGWRDCPFVDKDRVEQYLALEAHGFYHRFFSIMMSIAARAHVMGYEITAEEIETLMREIDAESGTWYSKRDIRREASNAIEYSRAGS